MSIVFFKKIKVKNLKLVVDKYSCQWYCNTRRQMTNKVVKMTKKYFKIARKVVRRDLCATEKSIKGISG